MGWISESADRRYDRGTDAMHLREYPSGKQKPRAGGVLVMFRLFASRRCQCGAALPSMNGLSNFLGGFQVSHRT
jgi:hypothetical protein